MPDTIWRVQFLFLRIQQYFTYSGFLGRWVWNRGRNCKIKNGVSNMAAKILIFCKLNSIFPIGVFRGAESESEFKIAKFKMAYPIWGPKFQFSQIKPSFGYRVFLRHWAQIRGKIEKIQNGVFKIVAKILIFRKSDTVSSIGVLRYAEFESEVKIAKFMIAETIWQPKF